MQLQRAQKLQNFAAKVAMGGGAKYDHATPFLRELGWLKIIYKYRYELAITVYKTIKEIIPSDLMTLPSIRDIRCLPTRQQNNLHVESPSQF